MTVEDKDAELKLKIGNNIRTARLNKNFSIYQVFLVIWDLNDISKSNNS